MSLEISQYWKLSDQLSVHDAACLIIQVDPEDTRELFQWSEHHDFYNLDFYKSPTGYTAAKNALIAGIRSKAITGHLQIDSDMNGNESTDLSRSYIFVDSLKSWLTEKGFDRGFFFQIDKKSIDYLDKNHPHYSPKLSAAVSAWEAVSNDATYQNNGKTTKQNLINWLTSHAAEFGLIKEDGEINNNAIENQVAMVANWDTSGGAPKTPI